MMPKPLYEQVAEDLREKLSRRVIAPGQRIASEQELCREYQVSSITVKRAMRELSSRGLVVRRPRLGTFAAQTGSGEPVSRGARKLKSLVFIGRLLNDELESDVVHGLSQAAGEACVRVVVTSSLNDPAREAELLGELAEMGADGAVILPLGGTANVEEYFRLKLEGRLPFVFLDLYYEGLEAPHVTSDNVAAGYALTSMLCKRGHRRIAFVGEDFSVISVRQRYEGYARALYERGIGANPALVQLVSHYTEREGEPRNLEPERHAYRQLLTAAYRPTAVVGASNGHARTVIEVAHEVGLDVPRDVAVVGMGGLRSAGGCQPRLTFMRQDFEAMGKGAFAALKRLVEEGVVEHREAASVLMEGETVAERETRNSE